MKKILFTALILISCFSTAYTQGLSMKETLTYINEGYTNVFQVRVEKDVEMFIDFYKAGNVYRTDRIYLPTLDHSKTKYNSEENALSLYCLAEMPREFKKMREGCVERTFHGKGMIKQYSRINILIEEDKRTQSLIKAFNHLIQLASDAEDYMGVDSFE